MTPKKTLAGLSATAIIMGGIDASALAETPLDRTEMVAEEIVQAKQVDNIVETNFPWKDQIGIKVKYDMGEPTVAEKFKDKRNKEVITETVDFGDGGFKVDILLNEKPATNVFCYQIEGAENYDFFYQSPLTAEEIAEGSSRPENIEGSYAVYHKTLANHRVGAENYATGKVMHIPRPQVWEMNNQASTTEWADLSYNEQDGLCVTARQEFLDNATYPVRVDPTFGYTTQGASTINIGSDNGFVNIATSTETGDVSKLTVFYTDTSKPAKALIYAGNQNDPTTKLGIGNSTPTSGSNVWIDLSFTSTIAVTATTYWIGFASDTTGGLSDTIACDTTDGNDRRDGVLSFATPADPWDTAGDTASSRKFSIYATYTAAATPATTTYSCSGGICGGVNLSGGMNIK